MPLLTFDELTGASRRLLRGVGATDAEAERVAAHLVNADLRGVVTHGVRAIVMYADFIRSGEIKPGAVPKIISDSPGAAMIDGGDGFGQVVCTFAMNTAIAKAKSHGVGVVGINRCNHIGTLADYTLMAAAEGLVAFMVANCGEAVAPAGGSTAQLGTNPISFACPLDGAEPIVLDMATSAVTYGTVATAQARGVQVPADTILDGHGNPTTDPDAFMGPPAGSILPLAGYKGYGLALMVDVLAGALTDTGCGGEIGWISQGVLAMVVQPEFFGGAEASRGRIVRLVERLKGSPKMAGIDEILLPGEKEARLKAERLTNGIPIDDGDWEALGKLAGEAAVAW